VSVRDNTLWKNWADRLRQEMMQGLTAQITKSVASITQEIGTDRSPIVLKSLRFWNSCRIGKSPNDVFPKAGLELDFQPNEKSEVELITIRLNDTWKAIMQRALDRNSALPRKDLDEVS